MAKTKKNRLKLSDIDQEGGLVNDSLYAISKASSYNRKVKPKPNKKSTNSFKTIRNSNETLEGAPYEESLYEVEKNIFYSCWTKFRGGIGKILKNKWFRRFHLFIEFLYFTLVLFYLYFVLEIEEDNDIAMLIIMMTVLFICLILYILDIVDQWRD